MELVRKTVDFLESIEKQRWFEVRGMVTEDFRFFGPMPDPVDKETWLSFQEAVVMAFPNWKFHLKAIEREEDLVFVTFHITGTHLGELQLPFGEFRPIPPTHTEINLPVERAAIKFSGGKVKEIRTESAQHTGIMGLFEQLGVE